MKHNWIVNVFALFGFLVVVDIILVIMSADYRNQLGAIDGRGVGGYLYRLLPDFLMIIFYVAFFLRYINSKTISKKLVLVHSVLYLLLGAALCVPWGGVFFAPMTPVCTLYLGAILWLPEGFYFSMIVAIAFFFLNGYLLLIRKQI